MRTLELFQRSSLLLGLVLGACGPTSEGEPVDTADSATHEETGAEDQGISVNRCPHLVRPGPGFCSDGHVVVVKGANGCPSYKCVRECPALAPPAPDFCPGGTTQPVKDDRGCIASYACVTCPTLSPPGPGFCPGGKVSAVKNTLGCVTGYTCTGSCPQLSPPGPGFCPTGDIEVVRDGECIVGYRCVQP